MKLSTQEVYGLRCILRIARSGKENGITIHEISEKEGISEAYTAKILRILRLKHLVLSERGKHGGYILADIPKNIPVSQVVNALGGKLYESDFCYKYHSDTHKLCEPVEYCSLRTLWFSVQKAVDRVLDGVTLQDILDENVDTKK
ncbi:TPA: transcriptional regulator [Candidatus Marinimicrobia bacterium]|jgi:Rrf2 family protein|uniref:RrF2 family transcriptional regulator n=1 Tax=Fidelibacter multiformis TaxID=3377529 RepID=UPI000ED988A1|nr:transcriptional regulator [Candidatus Neomarinimicrobiota bacterium]